MKKLNHLTILLLIFVVGATNLFASEKDVTDKVNQFLNTSQQKETKTIDNIVCDEVNFTMVNGIIGKKEILTKEDYLRFVLAGKADGWSPRTEIKSVDIQGDLAAVYLEADATNLMRREYLTLIMSNGEWKIVNSVSTLSKK